MNIKKITDKYSVKTPLQKIHGLSKKYNKLVLLKDETCQKGESFKIRGVSWTVWKAFKKIKQKHITLITQSTGNHAIATLLSIRKTIEMNMDNKLYTSVIPVIYGTVMIKPSKLKKIKKELQLIRKLVNDPNRGILNFKFNSYAEAKEARDNYIKKNKSIYISHGGLDTLIGHGTMGIELNRQLNSLKISKDKKISIILACGAGGIIGIGACLSLLRGIENVNTIITQTDDQDAFVKTLISNKMCYNDIPKLCFADGIAVDCPEEEAVKLAQKFVKVGDIVSHKYCYENLLPLVTKDINSSLKRKIPIGGTTTIGIATLEKNIKYIQDSDVIILLACEGNI
tara:strand:- start:128 stop:1150 length:1023 start_codon:yes stop_codon:yes gene_type:complete